MLLGAASWPLPLLAAPSGRLAMEDEGDAAERFGFERKAPLLLGGGSSLRMRANDIKCRRVAWDPTRTRSEMQSVGVVQLLRASQNHSTAKFWVVRGCAERDWRTEGRQVRGA